MSTIKVSPTSPREVVETGVVVSASYDRRSPFVFFTVRNMRLLKFLGLRRQAPALFTVEIDADPMSAEALDAFCGLIAAVRATGRRVSSPHDPIPNSLKRGFVMLRAQEAWNV